ncbi:MAG: cysteine peptidase family C39 domain-containing protein [Nonlabens sp.]
MTEYNSITLEITVTEDQTVATRVRDSGLPDREIVNCTYHPFAPVGFINADSPKFPFCEQSGTGTLLPAFVLYAADERADTANWFTAGEYALDLVTLASGAGNIYKFRHLLKLSKLQQVIRIGKAVQVAGRATIKAIEISSATLNILIKLAELENEPWAQNLQEILFWLEIASLSGEVTAAVAKRLQKSAREVVKHKARLITSVDEAVQPRLLNDLDELAERGVKGGDKSESFAAYARIDDLQDYLPDGIVTGQRTLDTCAACSLNILLNDLGKAFTENTLSMALGTTEGLGASIFRIPTALQNLNVTAIKAVSRQVKDVEDYLGIFKSELTNAKGAVVSVKRKGFSGAHAIVVDKIENGRVFIRDPYPPIYGSAYSISLKDFDLIFNKRYTLIK